jgi:hypothetical protein
MKHITKNNRAVPSARPTKVPNLFQDLTGNACILSLRARQKLTCLQRVLEFKDSSEAI